jgi:glycosyltransferase involved in cell wall biosynthesis
MAVFGSLIPMTDYPLDIIIPVWNRPFEVRSALASFASGSPMARLVMVNNGSERETESILDEFAEALDDRALLVESPRNIGTVAAFNFGLSRSTAPLILVATPFTRIDAGWFDSVSAFFERNSDAGSVTLLKNTDSSSNDAIETDHGCFDAMILKKSLYDSVGGFDETMDGAEWALRDFARRSLASGYKTFSLFSRHLNLLEQSELGSASRRDARARLARESYIVRWGEPETFFLNCTEALFGSDIDTLKKALLDSARQGNRFVVAAESKVAKMLLINGFSSIHSSISFHSLPRFFSRKALDRLLERQAIAKTSTVIISETEISGENLKRVSFSDFLSQQQKRSELYYQRGTHD